MHETRAVHSTIAAAPMADDDGSLEELTCPITNEVFLDPVLCVGDGMTYERVAAERWFKAHSTSPMTGEQLDVPGGVTLVDNHVVRKQAAALLERRPDLKPIGMWHAGDAVDDGAAAEEPSAPPLSSSSFGEPAASSSSHLSSSDAFAPPTSQSAILTGSHRGGMRAFTLTNRAYACPERDARWENVGVASGAAFVAASADGSLLMSGAQNSSAVSMWRPARHVGEPTPAPVTARLRDWSLCGAVDPRGEWCAAAGRGKKLELWRVSIPEGPGVSAVSITAADAAEADGDAPWHKDFVTCMTNLGFDGAKLVYGGDDWRLRTWDIGAKRGGAGGVVGECSAGVTSVVSSKDGNVIVAGTDDGETHAFDTRAGPDPVFSTFKNLTRDRVVDTLDVAQRHGPVTCIAVAEDGRLWAASGAGEGVKLYEPRMSWRETVCADGGDASVGLRCTAMAPLRGVSPSCLAIATEDGTVAAFDVASAASGLTIERKFTIQPPGAPKVTSLCAFAPTPLAPAVRPGANTGGGGQPRARSWFRTIFG